MEAIKNMSASTALNSVLLSKLSDVEKADYSIFIRKFDDLTFFQNSDIELDELEAINNVSFPESIRSYRKILADILFGKSVEIKFEKFTNFSPREDYLGQIWYSIDMVGISLEGDIKEVLIDTSRDFGFIPIIFTESKIATNCYLAINTKGNDKKIYEFNLQDIFDNHSSGEPIEQSAYPIFDNYPQMLAHISEIRYSHGKKKIIVKARET
jgi:hypothetical protein